MPNNKADEYMGNAQACMEVAGRMSLREDRERMVQMAERWLQRARQTAAPAEEALPVSSRNVDQTKG